MTQPNPQQHDAALRVRAAVAELNRAIQAAFSAGLVAEVEQAHVKVGTGSILVVSVVLDEAPQPSTGGKADA